MSVNTAALTAGGRFVSAASGQSASHSMGIFADPFAPRIAVESPSATGLADGAGVIDFGLVVSGASSQRVFTIRNTGSVDLAGLSISIDGANAQDFIAGTLGSTLLPRGATTTFTVTFSPGGTNPRTAAIHVASNVLGATNPFDISLMGTGLTQTEQWRLNYFQTTSNTGNAADTADPKNDGIVNLMKFATGMNPTLPGTMPGQVSKSGGDITFVYSRSKAAASDGITFTVKWSDTLSPGTWSSTSVNESALDQGAADLVTATVPVGGDSGRFVRLRVNRP